MNRWRHIARNRLAIVGAVVALVFAVCILKALLTPPSDVLSRRLRERGYPATLAELDTCYPAVPAAENAALIYTNAFAHLINNAGAVSNFLSLPWLLPPLGQGFTAEQKSDLTCVFEANRDALCLLHSVPPPARSRYPLDLREGYTLALPHLAQSRQAVVLLASEALMHAGNGNADLAARSFLAAGRVAESVGDEPLLISQKVRSMNWSMLLARLECALNLVSFSDSQMAALQQQVQAADRPRSALRGWVTEWVAGKTLFEDRHIMDSALMAQSLIAPRSSGAQLARLNPVARNGCMSLWRAAGQREKDKAFFLDYVEQRVAAMELPYPERFRAMQRLDAITNTPGPLCVFSQMLFAARTLLDCHDAEHCARIRVAETVLAIEQFRLAHSGALPSSLSELVPNWLEALPLDPFDGRPLRYQQNGSSYAVYSIGSDGYDSGGVAWDKQNLKCPRDIVLLVKH